MRPRAVQATQPTLAPSYQSRATLLQCTWLQQLRVYAQSVTVMLWECCACSSPSSSSWSGVTCNKWLDIDEQAVQVKEGLHDALLSKWAYLSSSAWHVHLASLNWLSSALPGLHG